MRSISLRAAWIMSLLVMAIPTGAYAAGFEGDAYSVSLTVHTAGAIDQVVWSNDPKIWTEFTSDSLFGLSHPAGVGTPLGYSFDELGPNTILFEVGNPNGVPSSLDPLLLTITGLDGATIYGVNIVFDNLGLLPSEISFTGSSVTISVNRPLPVSPLTSYDVQLEFVTVPEASTVVLMSLASLGAAGTVFLKRRRQVA